jgi:hypothetical protein
MNLGFGMPGIFELLIIGCVLAIPVAVVLIVLLSQRRTFTHDPHNPNLRPCPDCGRQISIRANTCPHCGGPVKGG